MTTEETIARMDEISEILKPDAFGSERFMLKLIRDSLEREWDSLWRSLPDEEIAKRL
jgi:hypothetical protein